MKDLTEVIGKKFTPASVFLITYTILHISWYIRGKVLINTLKIFGICFPKSNMAIWEAD